MLMRMNGVYDNATSEIDLVHDDAYECAHMTRV